MTRAVDIISMARAPGGADWWGRSSEVQLVDLGDHLDDARADELALLAEGGHFSRRAHRLAQTGLRRIELALEPADLVERLRPIQAERVDHRDERLDLLFEPIDGLKVDSGSGSG